MFTKCIIRTLRSASRSYHAAGTIPDLAQHRYNVTRGNFSKVEDKHAVYFENLLGSSSIITDSDDTSSYNLDFLKSVRGNSKLVLKPRSTEEVSKILSYCNQNNLAVCPQGGNTGLVGGSVPIFDEIVISLQNLNKIESIDEISGVLICQSGCILENLETHAAEHGLIVPIDLGAKASCHIGGNISTNAGGLRVLRYGNLHGSILGLEVVLADGRILNLLSHFKKDNTGYDLKHLFVGAEGTLGVVTKLAIKCPGSPKAVHVAFLGLRSFDAVLKTYLRAKRKLGEILSSCEFIDQDAFEHTVRAYKLNAPVSGYPFYMLIESSGSNAHHDEEKFNEFLESGMNAQEICDGTIANEPGKVKELWQLRERVPTALISGGYCFKYDLSIPLRNFYDIVLATKDQVGNLATVVCGYGHLGDSNIHLNVSCEKFTQEIYSKLEPFVYEYTSKLGGSVSAEHGIGFLKTKYLKYSKSEEAIKLMKQFKKTLDPKGILNPYKVLI